MWIYTAVGSIFYLPFAHYLEFTFIQPLIAFLWIHISIGYPLYRIGGKVYLFIILKILIWGIMLIMLYPYYKHAPIGTAGSIFIAFAIHLYVYLKIFKNDQLLNRITLDDSGNS